MLYLLYEIDRTLTKMPWSSGWYIAGSNTGEVLSSLPTN